jgi:putative ABC transport system ATP-binding protein
MTSNLKKYYGTEAIVKAIDGVDLAVERGEFVSIVGSSGSGKSTLLHLVGGLERPTEGSVEIDGRQIFTLKDDELTIFRRRNIGFVFQSYNLIPTLNVEENILLPIQLDGNRPDAAYISRVIETLGLADKKTSMPNQLSGGQQQRVAIARALASKPAIVLADEPTGNLDSKTSMDVMGLLKVSGERFGQTMVLITHNPEIAQMADRTVHIEDGRVVGAHQQ